MLVTFAGWLYVLFDGQCDLYLDVLGLYQVLTGPLCKANKSHFNKDRCALVT